MTICANCKTTQGPFYTSWGPWNIPICKPQKGKMDVINRCVEKRIKDDNLKYKEILGIL